MEIIHHRINDLSKLDRIPLNDGIEVDVRYHQDELILNHDPFKKKKKKETTLNHLLNGLF